MTSATVENLRRNLPEQPLRRIAIFTTVGITLNPTEVIVDDGSAYLTMPCLDGYRHRLPGDKVVAAQLAGNDWIVLGKISADDSPIVAIAQGDGPPTGGYWRQATNVWVFEGSDDRRSLYFDMTSAAPAPVVVEATDAVAWDGSQPSREAFQVSGTSGAAWYYGTSITDACSGKTATAMFLQITRSETGGADRPVPLKLGLHGGLIIEPTAINLLDPDATLVRGQTIYVPIPDLYLGAIADGVVGGFFAYAEDDTNSMTLEPEADLQIHFG